MAHNERENNILEYLKVHKQATVAELMRIFFVSSASVRRDLDSLQKSGLVKRTHGGVLYNEKTNEKSVEFRRTQNTRLKEKTVEIALRHIPDFETAFVDDSSTCFMLVEKMNLTGKTIVTNSLQLATFLSRKTEAQVIVPGGRLMSSTSCMVGSEAVEALQKYRFDVMLISCAAVDTMSAYEPSSDTAVLKRVAATRAKTKVLLFDSSKLKRTATFMSVDIADIDMIVTDADEKALGFKSTYRTRIYNSENSKNAPPPPTF